MRQMASQAPDPRPGEQSRNLFEQSAGVLRVHRRCGQRLKLGVELSLGHAILRHSLRIVDALAEPSAVIEDDGDNTRVPLRVDRIHLRVNFDLNAGGQIAHDRFGNACRRELIDERVAIDQRDGEVVAEAHLRVEHRRRLIAETRLLQHDPAGPDDHAAHVRGAEAVLRHQIERGVNARVIAAATAARLEAHRLRPPDAAEIAFDLVQTDVIRRRGEKSAVGGLENLARSLQALLREQRRDDSASGRSAGMKRLLIAPSALKAHRPADWVPARPSALAAVGASRPRITDAAAAAPKVPHVPVTCQPRIRDELGFAARLTRAMTS